MGLDVLGVLLCLVGAPTHAADALRAAAHGASLADAGEWADAVRVLRAATELDADSAASFAWLALALIHTEDIDGARKSIERAIALGANDPEIDELCAMILARLGETDAAKEAALRAGSWEGELIASALGHPDAAIRLAQYAGESSERGALSALALVRDARARGDSALAYGMADLARSVGERLRLVHFGAAQEIISSVIDPPHAWTGRAEFRAGSAWVSNPDLVASAAGGLRPGARVQAVIDAEVRGPFLGADFALGGRVDQWLYPGREAALTHRDAFAVTFDWGVWAPISRSPSSAELGFFLRLTDLYADGFDVHYATRIDGGPELVLPLHSSAQLSVALVGVTADFIDKSPLAGEVSSQNRDLVGQRAMVTVTHDADWIALRAQAAFVRDDAVGEAFDTRGGGFGFGLVLPVVSTLVADAKVAVTMRRFGPVGDPNMLGPAAFRTEARTVVEAGASYVLWDALQVSLRNTWVKTSARSGHAYTNNGLVAEVAFAL